MNHQQVVFHKRVAALFFALKSSSKFLFFTVIALVLRSVGFNPLQVGILRAASAVFSIIFVEFAVNCVRSPKKRKYLAHFCLALASANVLLYSVAPSSYQRSSSLTPTHCDHGNYSSNGTQLESLLSDDQPQPPVTVEAASSPGDVRTAASIATQSPVRGPFSDFFPMPTPTLPLARPGNPIDPNGNIGIDLVAPSGVISRPPDRGGVEPAWVRGIIEAQDNAGDGGFSIQGQTRRRRDSEGGAEVLPTTPGAPLAQPSPRSSAPLAESSPQFDSFGSLWESLMNSLSLVVSTHSFVLVCVVVVSVEVYFALIDRFSVRLYTVYLDQMEKNFVHSPFAHAITLLTLLTAVLVYVRFGCPLAPGLELPTALLGASGFVLALATLVFTCFPIPERQKILDRAAADPVKLTVYGDFRTILIFLALVTLGGAFGVEQNFLLWHLVERGADIPYVSAFIGIPVLMSGLVISRTPKRTLNVHRFLIAALLSVNIRFVAYSFYSENNVKWCILFVQILAPLSSTVLWRAVDSFLQQITFPSDHAPISRSMRFGFWGLGFSGGSITAGCAWRVYDPSVFLFVVGVSVGIVALALLSVNVCARIQDLKELHYTRLLETDHQSKQPINHFEETDYSDDDEDDQNTEFEVTASKKIRVLSSS
ncbi:uncharacterized protein LOC114828307 [Galendromus occidentalis]|uniref:Uncharacterized protein LOC114828307 n=1 Tax=Galendromus occidentalis TaxID=34638 RepID=A0AAJ7WHY7_9ACAR|nr:uncharacterized protein LOC114828307 [Galendromus occidentalis]